MDEQDKVKDEMKLVQEELDDIEEKIADNQTAAEDLQKKLDTDTNGQIKMEIENKRKDMDDLDEDWDAVEAKLKRLKREFNEIQDRIDYLTELVQDQ